MPRRNKSAAKSWRSPRSIGTAARLHAANQSQFNLRARSGVSSRRCRRECRRRQSINITCRLRFSKSQKRTPAGISSPQGRRGHRSLKSTTFHQAARPRAHICLWRLWTLRRLGASPLDFLVRDAAENPQGLQRNQLLELLDELLQNISLPHAAGGTRIVPATAVKCTFYESC